MRVVTFAGTIGWQTTHPVVIHWQPSCQGMETRKWLSPSDTDELKNKGAEKGALQCSIICFVELFLVCAF